MDKPQQRPKQAPQRMTWSSERAFILATAAGAIGLGNLWRFPYMVGANGGASFIIAYLIGVLVMGLPLMMLELSGGRYAKGGPVAMFRSVHPRAAAFGWLIVALTAIIMSYYLVVTGWTLGYAWDSVTGGVVPFASFQEGYASLWFFLIATALTSGIMLTGLSGMERNAIFVTPVLVLVVIVLAIYGMTMEGLGEAARFLLTPDWSALGRPSLWLFAFGQAFYSLGVGQGFLIAYASHLPPGTSVARSAVSIAGLNTIVALLAGWMIFPMVFTFGHAPDKGSELAFTTLPSVFAEIAGGRFLAPIFFTLFFAAALSSCIAGVKVLITALMDEFHLKHTAAVSVSTALLVVMGIPSALSHTPVHLSLGGRPFLEVMDMFTATQVIITSGIVGGALISWLTPRERLLERLEHRYRFIGEAMVTVGRYLGLPVLAVLLYTWLRG